MFINEIHKKNFLELEKRDNTHFGDIERLSLFYILSSEILYNRADSIYNFKEHTINSDYNMNCLSSAEKSLIKLGFHLFTESNEYSESICDIFSKLDSDNQLIALNAIKIRFEITNRL